MSESDNDPTNSTVNLWIDPSRFIPPDRAESNPNVSVSGFIYKSPYTGPGTWLHSQQNRYEVRVAGVMERFERLKTKNNEWEILLNSQVIPPVGMNRQFDLLSRVVQDLAREALLARVVFPMCGEISNYKNIINRIKQNVMKEIDPQINLAPSPPNRNSDSVFRNELNLSTIDPPSNRMQRTRNH